MSKKNPRVSIGMAVRNGQRYLAVALESLLSQTFTDFEIIISDNASTDATAEICRQYMARDPRVRYHRNETDIGPANNHNQCFEMSHGEYFRWHAHDDACTPQHLELCVSALDRDPTAVLAYPQTLVIDENGRPMSNYDFKLETDSASPAHRFAELVLVNHRRHRAVEIFGLMRSSALRITPLQGRYARGDSVLLVRMALRGRFIQVPGRHFLSRTHSTQSVQQVPSRIRDGGSRLAKYLGTGPTPPPEWWDSSRKGKLNFPEWNLLRRYWGSIEHAPVHFSERAVCHLVMLQWLALNAPKLVRDMIFAAEIVAGRIFGPRPPTSSAQTA